MNRLFEISWVTVGRIAARVVGEKLDPNRLEGLSFDHDLIRLMCDA